MALYPRAVKKLIPPGSNDPKIKARVVILHVAATEADSLYSYFNGPSGGVESHFYVKYDGTVEQYRDTAYQADANVMANDFAISIESQGLANGTWTAAQLAAVKELLLWCKATHGIPLVKCPTWDGSGVGYHILFEAQWDQRGASCPGPNRIKQFDNVLVPWMAAGGKEDTLSDAQVQEIKDYTAALLLNGYTVGGVAKPPLLDILIENQRRITTGFAALGVDAIAKAVVAQLPAAPAGSTQTVDVAALSKGVVDELSARGLTLILGKA